MFKSINVIATFNKNGDIKPWYVMLDGEQLQIDRYTSKECNYAATRSVEFECNLENGKEITIIYFVTKHEWKLKG